MKHTLRSLLVMLLAVVMTMGLFACAGKGSNSSGSSDANTTDDEAIETTEAPSATEDLSKMVCQNKTTGKYYEDYQSALDEMADGDELTVLIASKSEGFVDLTVKTDGGKYYVNYNKKKTNFKYNHGFVVDNGRTCQAYYSDLEMLLADEELNGKYLWVWADTEEYSAGRYLITGEVGSYTLTKLEDITYFGAEYVCSNAVTKVKFYDLQTAINHMKTEETIDLVEHMAEKYSVDFVDVVIPADEGRYKLAYCYKYANLKFNYGVTFDDGQNGLCYYSSLEQLFAIDGLTDMYIWVWTNAEGYEPGQYAIRGTVNEYTVEKVGELADWGSKS